MAEQGNDSNSPPQQVLNPKLFREHLSLLLSTKPSGTRRSSLSSSSSASSSSTADASVADPVSPSDPLSNISALDAQLVMDKLEVKPLPSWTTEDKRQYKEALQVTKKKEKELAKEKVSDDTPSAGDNWIPKSVRIVSTFTNTQSPNKSYTVYSLLVKDEEENSWTTNRRFTDFYNLHQKLCLLYGEETLPQLPAKKLVNKTKEFVEQRRDRLEEYLQALMTSRVIIQLKEFRTFLQQDITPPPPSPPRPSLLIATTSTASTPAPASSSTASRFSLDRKLSSSSSHSVHTPRDSLRRFSSLSQVSPPTTGVTTPTTTNVTSPSFSRDGSVSGIPALNQFWNSYSFSTNSTSSSPPGTATNSSTVLAIPWATILPSVLVFFGATDLFRLERVSTTWQLVLRMPTSDEIWRRAFLRKNWTIITSAHPMVTKQGAQTLWRDRIRNRALIDSNWREGKFTESFMQHNRNYPVFSVVFFNQLLAANSQDFSVKIWDLETGKRRKRLEGHKGNVMAIQMNERIVVSGSVDLCIKIFDLNTGVTLSNLEEHKDSVVCLALSDKTLISGSGDSTCKSWDLSTGKCVQTLAEHREKVRAIYHHQLHDTNTLITASTDRTLRLWDLRTSPKSLHTLKGHADEVCTLYWDGLSSSPLCSGSLDNTIKLWDLRSLSSSSLEEKILDSLSPPACLQTIEAHSRYVWTLAGDGKYLISGSWDYTVKLWELKSLSLKAGELGKGTGGLAGGGGGGAVLTSPTFALRPLSLKPGELGKGTGAVGFGVGGTGGGGGGGVVVVPSPTFAPELGPASSPVKTPRALSVDSSSGSSGGSSGFGKLTRTLADVGSFVACTQSDGMKLVISDFSGAIRIWDFAKGGTGQIVPSSAK